MEQSGSEYVKQRILFYLQMGKSSNKIKIVLEEEGLKASKLGISSFFLGRYRETGTVARRSGSGLPQRQL